jgi:thiol-disulfide isomerase/thioredoxin
VRDSPPAKLFAALRLIGDMQLATIVRDEGGILNTWHESGQVLGKAAGARERQRLGRSSIEVRGMMKMTRGIIGLLVAMAVCGVAVPQGTQKRAAVRDPEMIDAAGYQKLLAKYHGQPLLITFWATWCEPCRAEYPMLNELAKQYAPRGLKVVGVNLDDDGDIILTRRFMARYKPVFPNYRKKAGEERAFVAAVLPEWSGAIPASFFYARDGRQVGKLLGESDRETYEAAIQAVIAAEGN